LVVLTITVVLLTIGLPSLRDIIERNVVAGHVGGFLGAVSLARGEAIKRGITVVMCRSTDAETATTPTCTGALDWRAGWIVFSDRNGNLAIDSASGDVLVRAQGPVTSSGGIIQNTASALTFRPTGLMGAGATSFTFESASGNAAQRRRVCMTLQGRTHVTTDGTATC
jgi:type IV fimbrial biogenesis protein FimT